MNLFTGNRHLLIVGGPNGVGKTTLAREFLLHHEFEYLSADDIAFHLNPTNPAVASVEAGKVFYRRLYRYGENGKPIIMESTLSGKAPGRIMKRFRNSFDYEISLVFIFVDNPAICVERIKTRVQRGEHRVPVKDVERRYRRAILNFWKSYRFACNRWALFHNTGHTFREVAAQKQGEEMYVFNDILFDKLKNLVKRYE